MATPEELIADERVKKVAYSSLHRTIGEIVSYAVDAERPVRCMMDAYVRDVFPYSKKPNPSTEETQQTLKKFWKDISKIGCQKFEELEWYLLLTDDSSADLFPHELKKEASSKGKGYLISKFIEPVTGEKSRGRFDYTSLDDLLKKLEENRSKKE